MRLNLEDLGRLLLRDTDWRRESTPTLEERVEAVESRVNSLAVRVDEIARSVPQDDVGK